MPDQPKTGMDDFLGDGHSLQDALSHAVPLDEAGLERPVPTGIVANGRQLPEITQEALAALVRFNNPPKLFVQGGAIVRPRLTEQGHPVVDQVGESLMVSLLALSSPWQRFNRDGTLSECFPPLAVAKDILSGAKWPFPPLAGIVEAPVLRDDWTVLDTPGYDNVSGLIYWPSPGLKVPSVPQIPTRQEAKEALAFLRSELLSDFPFADDASYANALAGLLTPLQQNRAPILLLDAPERGSGKTLLASLSGIIATGRAVLQAVPTDPGEWRKAITATLLGGERVVVFDNLENRLDSSYLAQVLTAGVRSDRLLGRTQLVRLRVNSFFYATGTNITLGGDIPRRAVKVRLDPKVARPWLRSDWKHPDLEGWALEHRGELLAALLTILRAWHCAGRPESDAPVLSSFGGWCKALGGTLTLIGVKGFLGNLPAVYEESDSETPEWDAFLRAWHDVMGDVAHTIMSVEAKLTAIESFRDAVPDSLAGELSDLIGNRKNRFRRRLGYELRHRVDTVFPSGATLRRAGHDTHTKTVLWRVVFAGDVAEKVADSDTIAGDGGDETAIYNAYTGAHAPENGNQANHHPQSPATDTKSAGDTQPSPAKSPVAYVQYHLCGACGGHDFWQRPDGGWVCNLCHPDPTTLGRTPSPQTRTPFTPTNDWQEVPPNSILPAGCEICMDFKTDKRYARWDSHATAQGGGVVP